MGHILALRHPAFPYQRLYPGLHQCLFRDDVGLYHHRCHHRGLSRTFSKGAALLALADTVDRWLGHSLLYHCHSAFARRRFAQGVCSRVYRADQEQAAPSPQHGSQVDMDGLSRPHDCMCGKLQAVRHDLVRLFQLCHDQYGYGRLCNGERLNRNFPFSCGRVCVHHLLLPFGRELHLALHLCGRLQVQATVQEQRVQVLHDDDCGLHPLHHAGTYFPAPPSRLFLSSRRRGFAATMLPSGLTLRGWCWQPACSSAARRVQPAGASRAYVA